LNLHSGDGPMQLGDARTGYHGEPATDIRQIIEKNHVV